VISSISLLQMRWSNWMQRYHTFFFWAVTSSIAMRHIWWSIRLRDSWDQKHNCEHVFYVLKRMNLTW
jgi:hypothetical protein